MATDNDLPEQCGDLSVKGRVFIYQLEARRRHRHDANARLQSHVLRHTDMLDLGRAEGMQSSLSVWSACMPVCKGVKNRKRGPPSEVFILG